MTRFAEWSLRRAIGLLALALAWSAAPGRVLAAGEATIDATPAGSYRTRLTDLGSTRRLEILPLVDWATARPELRGEAGVSYLVRTDRSTILFDVGGNLDGTDPSPLVANMRQLGIRLADIDAVVISHNHMDHVGGRANAAAATFSLGLQPVDLRDKRVFVPVPMSYPGIEPVVTREPAVLAPGVATAGPMPGRLHMGPVDEQALAIRVEGKGIVLVVGCGHQGLPNLLARAAQLFDEPLYGVIGGLHYPVPRGRLTMGGMDVQRWATYGLGPGPSAQDVQREIDQLAARQPQWVSISPHDSSDESIEAFRRTFGPRFHDLRVGEWQQIGDAAP